MLKVTKTAVFSIQCECVDLIEVGHIISHWWTSESPRAHVAKFYG